MTPNVSNYLLILGSKLIDQDRKDSAREAKRGAVNVYRMGLLLEAANLVKDDMAGLGGETSMEAMARLKKSLSRRFDPSFPPIKSMIKLIDSSPAQLKYGPGSGSRSRASTPNRTNAQIEVEIDEILKGG